MAKYRILYWQEIPSVVEAREGRQKAKGQLSLRFQELIDLIAMRRKLDSADEYLLHWSKAEWQTRDGSAENVVKMVSEEIEAEYEKIKTTALEKTV